MMDDNHKLINMITEPPMGRQPLSRSVWTEVEQLWCRRIGGAALCREIVLLPHGLLGLQKSPVLQVGVIFIISSSLF